MHRETLAFIIVADLHRKSTIKNAEYLLETLREENYYQSVILVGNKYKKGANITD